MALCASGPSRTWVASIAAEDAALNDATVPTVSIVVTTSLNMTSCVRVRSLTRLLEGDCVVVNGWVRSLRKQKKIHFLSLNDGSDLDGVQVIVGKDEPVLSRYNTRPARCRPPPLLRPTPG